MAAKLEQSADAPAGFTDYVARFTRPGSLMRSQVYRAVDEAGAVALALASLDTPAMNEWRLVDIVTMDEAIARRGGSRG